MAANYYWVGGTGNWNDLANWASSSGGAGNAYPQIPQSTDNVIFDANSFTANNQAVNINGTSTFCKNFDASGITKTGIVFNNNSTLNIYGDFLLNTRIAYFNTGVAYPSITNFLAPGAATINTNGVDLKGAGITFGMPATGNYTFMSNLSCSDPIFNFQISSGTVNFNNNTITVNGLMALGGILNLNTSTVNCTIITIGSSITLNGGTSNVIATDIGLYTTMNNISSFYNLTISEYSARASDWTITCSNTLTFLKGMGLTSLLGSKFTSPTLKLNAGYSYYLPETVNTNDLIINGQSCLKPTGLYGRTGGTTINRNNGSWLGVTYTNLFLTGLKFTGGTPGNAIANSSVDGGGNTGIIFFLSANTLYWIGGRTATGDDNWNNPANWSTTSGGVPATCIPDLNTDVIFDANSFTVPGRTVKLNAQENFCKNMTWVGAINNPVFQAAPPAGITESRLLIKGSLEFAAGMSTSMGFNILGLHIIMLGQGNQTIKSNGVSFDGILSISANGGNYKLLDGLTVSRRFDINYGTFDTDGNPVNVNALYILSDPNSTSAAAINLRNSAITIDYRYPPTTAVFDLNYPLLYDHRNATCDFGTSTITINAPGTLQPDNALYLDKSNGALNFNNVIIGNTITSIPEISLYNNTISFNNLTLRASIKLNYNNNNAIRIRSSLVLSQAKSYTIEGGKTIDFGNTGTLNAAGNCAGFIKIQSSNTTPVVFTKSGGMITGIYLQLTNIIGTGSATYHADNGITFGNTSGWNIIPYPPRNLYWVGDSGNWGDISHWSLTSGGANGECPPTAYDNVFFDANSFTLPNQTVSFDLNPDCHDFNALGVTFNPTFKGANNSNTFNLYGSLIFSNAMVWNFKETFNILGAGTNTLATKNKELAAKVYFDATGSYKLDDDFTCLSPFLLSPSYFILRKGSLDLNDKRLSTNYVLNSISSLPGINSAQTGPINFKLKGSVINVNNWAFGIPATPTFFPITVDAGTSWIRVANSFTSSAGINYYDVEAINSVEGAEFFSANAQAFTVHDFIVQTKATISTEMIVTNDLTVKPGATLRFAGTKISFTKPGDIQLIGTGSQPITITSFTIGQTYNFIKATGRICADFIYIRDSKASGGATFTGGANANDQGNNQGWDFNPYPLPGTVSYSNSTTQPTCQGTIGQLTVMFTTFAPQDFPKQLDCTITRGATVKDSIITINSRNNTNPAGPYVVAIGSINQSTAFQIKKVTSGGCFQKQTDLTSANLVSRFSVIIRPTAMLINPGNQTEICVGTGLPLTFTLTGTPPFNFKWTDGRNIINVSNYQYKTYDFVVTRTGDYSMISLEDTECSAIKPDLGIAIHITVNDPKLVVTDPPIAVVPATVDLTAPSITAGSTGISSFNYYADANGTIPLNTPTAINQSGIYYIKGLNNTCQTALVPVKVTIAQNYTPVIPNVFTPNGDGKNDVFYIGNLEVLLNASLKVYNRWGSLVYGSDNYKNDWNGLKLNDGTYFYVLTCKSTVSEVKYSGWLYIKR